MGEGLLSPLHLLIILVIAFVFFGAKRLPEMGRSLGGGLREFKRGLSGVTDELDDTARLAGAQPPAQIAAPTAPIAAPTAPIAPPAAQIVAPAVPVAPPTVTVVEPAVDDRPATQASGAQEPSTE